MQTLVGHSYCFFRPAGFSYIDSASDIALKDIAGSKPRNTILQNQMVLTVIPFQPVLSAQRLPGGKCFTAVIEIPLAVLRMNAFHPVIGRLCLTGKINP